ncbi:MAG: ankyrin repeat domain-containing protein [Bacteroidota bacterium]|nr:ankyrin repeat domain-containing protein [Bacteroidota bacterium]MDP4231805.1 ankyrin repeat domain-containing protein [Bacteroidota bacterium]MDP4242691.1 ankyrin repeat domain-containing protein [Bacteroidota bacterium]MDP4287142.1 ankyrin repeat domain-containing protein [Bacteroidota bacterium]
MISACKPSRVLYLFIWACLLLCACSRANRTTGSSEDANSLGDSPLHMAVGEGDLGKIKHLVESGADPNLENKVGFTPFSDAVTYYEGNSNRQLQAAADMVRWRDSSGLIRHARYLEIIRFLLGHGASPNVSDKWGGTPLHNAAAFCDSAIIALLLQHGANKNAKDLKSETPLDIAIAHGCGDSVRVLLK